MTPRRPFWTLTKIYWLLWVLPLAAWFAMDGAQMFYFEPDLKHPERVWFKLGVYLILVNFMTLLAWLEDRRRAERGDWRISENTLLYLVILGGLPGALLAMRMSRHKAKKWSFQIRVFLWAAAEAGFAALLLGQTFSKANDLRWALCLFPLFWWNLEVSKSVVRALKGPGRDRVVYLATLLGLGLLFLSAGAGSLYLWDRMKGCAVDWERGTSYVRAAILAAGAILVVFNEVTLSTKKLRGRLPGWDPTPPAEAK